MVCSLLYVWRLVTCSGAPRRSWDHPRPVLHRPACEMDRRGPAMLGSRATALLMLALLVGWNGAPPIFKPYPVPWCVVNIFAVYSPIVRCVWRPTSAKCPRGKRQLRINPIESGAELDGAKASSAHYLRATGATGIPGSARRGYWLSAPGKGSFSCVLNVTDGMTTQTRKESARVGSRVIGLTHASESRAHT